MMENALPYAAVAISLLTFLMVAAEKTFGGGNALANKFHNLEKDVTLAMSVLRTELNKKIDEYEDVSTVGFEAIKNNIHAMQLGLLEFRAKMSEDLHQYIRKDDYNAGLGEIKRDVQNGFRSVDERLGQMQDLIVYANPDTRPPNGQKRS